MPFGCSPEDLSSCNDSVGIESLKLRAVTILDYYEKSHTIGYALITPISVFGFGLNLYLTVLMVRLWRSGKINWKHFPVALTVVVVDVIGSALMFIDATVHLVAVKGMYKFAGKYAALAVGSFVWAFVVPALGYAILGILQTAAIVDPLKYTRAFHTRKAAVIALTYLTASVLIFFIFTGVTANYVHEEQALISEAVYKMALVIVVSYGVLMLVFIGCNIKITQVLWRQKRFLKNIDSDVRAHQASVLRFHILLHTVVGVSFVVTHGISIYKFQTMLRHIESTKDELTCDRCFKLYDIKQQNQVSQLFTWSLQVCWSTRFVIEPLVMLKQREVTKVARSELRKFSRSISRARPRSEVNDDVPKKERHNTL